MGNRTYKARWIVIALLLGLFLVYRHISQPESRLEGVYLEVGAGLILFAALFLYERQLVERTAESVYRRISGPEELADLSGGIEDSGDFRDDDGPVVVAYAFLDALRQREYRAAFGTLDNNYRLCLLQSWAYDRVSELKEMGIDVVDGQLDELAERVGDADSDISNEFIDAQSSLLREAIGGFDPERYGLSWHRRILGPRHELLQFIKGHGGKNQVMVFDGPTVVTGPVVKLVMSCQLDENGQLVYRVAAVQQEVAPSPGWPPTFWVRNDPVARSIHPGLQPRQQADSEERREKPSA